VDARLLQDVFDVLTDGVNADLQVAGNLGGAAGIEQHYRDEPLPWREPEHHFGRRRAALGA
jgi:hypothetical protein